MNQSQTKYLTKAGKFIDLYSNYIDTFKFQGIFSNIFCSVYDKMSVNEKEIMDNFFKEYLEAVKYHKYNLVSGNQEKYDILFDKIIDFIKSIYFKYIQEDGIINRRYKDGVKYEDFISDLNNKVEELKNTLELNELYYNIGNKIKIGNIELTKIKPELNENGYTNNYIYGHILEFDLRNFYYENILFNGEDIFIYEDGLYITNDGFRVDINNKYEFSFYAKDEDSHPLFNYLNETLDKMFKGTPSLRYLLTKEDEYNGLIVY